MKNKKMKILSKLLSNRYRLSLNTSTRERVTIVRLNVAVLREMARSILLSSSLFSSFYCCLSHFDSHSFLFSVWRPEILMMEPDEDVRRENKSEDRERMKFLIYRDVAQFRRIASSDGTIREILYS